MTRVIIDTDPGTDDALALIMALNSSDLDIQALTTVGGNASLAHTTRNALRLLDYLGRADIPVHRGAARPLRGRFGHIYNIHGPGGLTVKIPLPVSAPHSQRATACIIELARSSPGELTLIALGPLTNVAKAIVEEPRLREWVSEIVVMGGAVCTPGNVNRFAEFNIYNDAPAASLVFASGIPITLVGLDVCKRVYVGREDSAWAPGPSTGARLASRIVDKWFALDPARDRYLLYDPLAIAAVVRPDLLTYEQATVTVETEDAEQLGRTSASFGVGSVRVATNVRADEAMHYIGDLLGGH